MLENGRLTPSGQWKIDKTGRIEKMPGCAKVQVTPCASLRTVLYLKGEDAQLERLTMSDFCVVLVWMLICFGGWCGSVENGLGLKKCAQQCVELEGVGSYVCSLPSKDSEKE